MSIPFLLATSILTKDCIVTQQVLKPLSNQQTVSQELLPLAPEPIAQITPVHQLDVESINERLTTNQNQLKKRVEALQSRPSDLESQQFYPTVSLTGEVIFSGSGVSGKAVDEAAVLQSNIELTFNVSFTGEDSLEIGLESENSGEFSFLEELTFEGRLSLSSDNFSGDTEGNGFELSELSYRFPIGERVSVYFSTTGDDLNDFNPFLGDDSDGAISEFGSENPINSLIEDVGIQLDYELTEELTISLGYFGEEPDEEEPGIGLFQGNQTAFAQLEFEPSDWRSSASAKSDRFLLGLTYIYTYNDSSLETETGSLRSQINLERPVVGNSSGISLSFAPSSKLAIGGWVGWTNANVIDVGSADVWNYALTLAFLDFGKENNLLGVIIGQEPRLTRTSGFVIDELRSDPDTSLHIEIFYSNRFSDNITVTPGLVWITAPNHDNSNRDLVVFTLRTTFEF